MLRTHRLWIDGNEIVCEDHGEGRRSFLLLHGLPGCQRAWCRVAPDLARHGRVLVPDLLGFGDSGAPHGDFHAAGQARLLAGLLDQLGVDAVDLVGVDFGGPTALRLLASRPDRIRSLVVAATNVFTDTPIPGPLRLARVPVLGDLAFRMLFGRIGLTMLWWQAAGDREAFPWRAYREELSSPLGVVSTRRLLLASLRRLSELYAEVEAALETVRVPTTVLWGDRDPFFSVTQGERTAAALRARFTLLPGCGHFVPQERPRETVEAILATRPD